jgi:hypothetical protein
MSLNIPYTDSMQFDLPPFQGTYSDLIFLIIYKLVHNGPRLLKPMYKSLISILSNLAPYTKSLCKESANALIYLIQVFSRKNFLIEKEDNAKVLANLCETLSYLLAYQDEGNQKLQFTLLRNREVIETLD